MKAKRKGRRRILTILFVNILLAIALLLLFEGLASAIFIAKDAFFGSVPTGRHHTHYDPEIGWVNDANLDIPDLFGPGVYFKTNSRSFRGDREYGATVPDGKVRVVCSGDSFTMGYGVDDDHTWCHLLALIDDRLETVNLGHGGYGIDQSYLWYKRNSSELDRDVHIFAFVTSDFVRMQSDRFLGYGRPWMAIEDGELVVTNEPVPKRAYYWPRATHSLQVLARLNSLRLVRSLLGRQGSPAEKGHPLTDPRCRQLALKIFEDIHKIDEARNSVLVLTYLPTQGDFMGSNSDQWREFLRGESERNGWCFVDLVEEFRTYPPHLVGSLFSGHYSEKGNAYIAEILYERLLAIPRVAERFNGP